MPKNKNYLYIYNWLRPQNKQQQQQPQQQAANKIISELKCFIAAANAVVVVVSQLLLQHATCNTHTHKHKHSSSNNNNNLQLACSAAVAVASWKNCKPQNESEIEIEIEIEEDVEKQQLGQYSAYVYTAILCICLRFFVRNELTYYIFDICIYNSFFFLINLLLCSLAIKFMQNLHIYNVKQEVYLSMGRLIFCIFKFRLAKINQAKTFQLCKSSLSTQ